jgi:hypothetical protein
MANEPWGFYEGAHPRLPGVAPGWLAAARRAEALERAREEREADERRARAEDRFDRWQWQRMQEMAWRGQPFDPSDISTLVRTPEQLAAAVFGRQDAEAARAERRALVEAGVLHDLGPRFAGEMPSPDVGPSAGSPTPGVARGEGIPAAIDYQADQSIEARVRRALRRWTANDRARRRATERSKETWK